MSVQFVVGSRINSIGNRSCSKEQNRLILLVNQSLHLLTGLCEVTVIDSTHLIQFVHKFQTFFVLITCSNTGNFVCITVQSNIISYIQCLGFAWNKGIGIQQPILHTGVPSFICTCNSNSIRFHFQEFLADINKFICSSRNFASHLIQIISIYPHLSCIFTMITVIDISK